MPARCLGDDSNPAARSRNIGLGVQGLGDDGRTSSDGNSHFIVSATFSAANLLYQHIRCEPESGLTSRRKVLIIAISVRNEDLLVLQNHIRDRLLGGM